MKTVHITRKHKLDKKTVRREVQSLADKLADELSAECSWEKDRLSFNRKGAKGHIQIGKGELEVEIKLGLALSPLKGKIEKIVSSYLDEHLA